ncbi:Wadjet anti-phage system protein JetD domain-containing protein [Stieleria varia]|uniref:Wadjet protein JetD C-terminal domain-containing protein n=1 Tax=Stieleria varia TaxID=2528005 RepID=A0A5C6B2X4_9BACT|nr:Wadjet anti-phage system protein JetD domain-containing protein [Stieleria varia]TWU06167.1 hypothetical protein Pla52n_18870 [Stieleria varia]
MITPEAIAEKASRVYPKAVKAWLAGELESFFPHRISANLSLPKNHADAIAEVERLRKSAKQSLGHGYTVAYESRRSRTHGLNQFPTAIWIETMEDLVHFTGTSAEFSKLQIAASTLRTRRPELSSWLTRQSNWKHLLSVANDLEGLLDIVDFFVAHPRPDCFARELPIAVSTKLLESNRRRLATWLDLVLPPHTIDHRYGYDAFEPRYGLRYARPHFLLRVLDRDFQSELGLPFDELSIPAESLARLSVADARILIVENKVNLLALPTLHRTIALGGLGNGVTQLSDIGWLRHNQVYYWGDLDADGFVILDRLRQSLPHLQSLLMDQSTYDQFADLATKGNASDQRELSHLTEDERCCYEFVCRCDTRVEQEHLPNEYLLKALQDLPCRF